MPVIPSSTPFAHCWYHCRRNGAEPGPAYEWKTSRTLKREFVRESSTEVWQTGNQTLDSLQRVEAPGEFSAGEGLVGGELVSGGGEFVAGQGAALGGVLGELAVDLGDAAVAVQAGACRSVLFGDELLLFRDQRGGGQVVGGDVALGVVFEFAE